MNNVRKLTWRGKGVFKKIVEIFSGPDLYGQLRIFSLPTASWYKTEAQISSGQRWIFAKAAASKLSEMLFNRRILIKEADGEKVIAVFHNKIIWKFKKEFKLKFLTGRFFIIKIDYLSNNPFLIIADAVTKDDLLRFNFKVIKWKFIQPSQGEIEIMARAEALPELPILILFGQYLVGAMRTGVDVY